MENIIKAAQDAGILTIVDMREQVADQQAAIDRVKAATAQTAALDRAKAAIKLAVRARYIDLPITSIEVSDEDARRYIAGATIEELLG